MKTNPDTRYIKINKPISPAYPNLDTDLAHDNMENGIPAVDLEYL